MNHATLLQQLGLNPESCLNYHACRTAADRPPDEAFELAIPPHSIQGCGETPILR